MTQSGTTRWLSASEQEAWRGLLRSSAQIQAALNHQLQEEYGLSSPDYAVLVVLAEAEEGRLRLYEIAEELAWERSRISHHLTRMARRGLIERRECPTDARGAFAVITEDGRRALEGAAPAHAEQVRALVFDALDETDVADLARITGRMLTHIRGLPAPS
jgi:DNA-binding MarR family transcriptional regulator